MNKWKISKHRYYELKHFCLQYHEWVKAWRDLDRYTVHSVRYKPGASANDESPVEKVVVYGMGIHEKIDLIERTVFDAEPEIAIYLLKAVTEGLSYTVLSTQLGLPCGRDMYYDRYRKFFWLLDKRRG